MRSQLTVGKYDHVAVMIALRTSSWGPEVDNHYKDRPRRQPFSETFLARLHPGNYTRPTNDRQL